MEEKLEQLGVLIDEIDNLAHALNLPLPPQVHVDQLKAALPEKVNRLQELFVEISGDILE